MCEQISVDFNNGWEYNLLFFIAKLKTILIVCRKVSSVTSWKWYTHGFWLMNTNYANFTSIYPFPASNCNWIHHDRTTWLFNELKELSYRGITDATVMVITNYFFLSVNFSSIYSDVSLYLYPVKKEYNKTCVSRTTICVERCKDVTTMWEIYVPTGIVIM